MARGNEGIVRNRIQHALQNIRTISSGELQSNVLQGEPKILRSSDYALRDLYYASKSELARREQEKLRKIAEEERIKQAKIFAKQQENLRKVLQEEFELERKKLEDERKELEVLKKIEEQNEINIVSMDNNHTINTKPTEITENIVDTEKTIGLGVTGVIIAGIIGYFILKK